MNTAGAALEIAGLDVRFRLRRGRVVRAATDVDLTLHRGRLLALVGESGCGKSVLTEALTGLLPGNAETRGRAVLHPEGTDLLTAPETVLRDEVRGRRIGLVGQSAGTFLTPTRTVGAQLREAVHHLGGRVSAAELAERAALPVAALDDYPHELSGGTAQRAGLAAALAGDPDVLLADEPTAGLDRPLVDRTTDLLADLARDGRAVLLITHDLRAVQRIAATGPVDLAVMYASRIVETGPAAAVFDRPWHPYTAGLVGALPGERFVPVPGHPPELSDLPSGCPFRPRCGRAGCTDDPTLVAHGDRAVACAPVGAS
ncbi:ABC transporter ATP-binding protein [Actinomycetospora sp. NBRC 106378]|uniref:oligopeptide/dipeptide ABC transporter ATP-binding protein n=1 Tax=Actinomycetospora sp. NBRC 106378 TaxID=3032208 RepID=UPI0024A4E050|nr:ABC transporter ATP-binding protein [Actinomycetospora sp. NBRC 106378]GLZ54564.1 ABC transporter ATP-binding protein [Actinomycetospora sp. NBRC 106378]